MGGRLRRRGMVAGISMSLTVGAMLIAAVAARAETYPPPPSASANAGQPFASSVIAEYHNLARRADPLAARKTIGPDATDCKHQEGITRKDGPDGTPYLFISRSGKDPGVACFVDDEPGTIYVLKMGSRDRDGERMHTNLLPYDGSALKDRPNVASGEDVVVKAIKLGTNGFPSYMHPGGMQAVGDLLVIGTEDPIDNPGASQATVMFVDVHDPESPEFLGQLDIEDAGDDAGSDPVGLTVVKDGDGNQRYLLVTAGGPANKEVRFYRSPVITDPFVLDPSSWELVRRSSYLTITTCMGGSYLVDSPRNWPIGTGLFDTGQHQMFGLVRQGDLDGPLFLFGGRRDGAIVNPFADEYLDLYQVNLTADGVPAACPLIYVDNGTRQMGETSMGEPLNTGSFSAASGMYVSPAGELMVYEAPHENGDVILFGQFRALDLVSHTSPLLHPTATVNGPVVVDEGSSVRMTGQGEQAQTKAFVELFQDEGAGVSLSDPVWFPIEYDDWAELGAENLKTSLRWLFDPNAGPYLSPMIWEETTSMRWFAPPGCTIAATDYPITSNDWPGPSTVLLRGTGQVEKVSDLHDFPTYKPAGEQWPLAPVPGGVTPTEVDFNDDIEGISFTKPVDIGGTVFKQLGCDNYYDATIELGWDLDDDGTYDASGTFALFSATQLDGPTTKTVTARAQHPTDTSDLGTGAPFSFPVTVRNVPPQVQQASIVDSLGHDLTAPGSIAVVGLPVSLSVDFTDPGKADTQTATVDWGDGTTSTTFDTFTDAHGGAVGHLKATHIYASAGEHTITATLTDDDGGATPVGQTIHVLSLEDALSASADQITVLIGTTSDGSIAAALTSARDDLIGNHGGKPPTNGALDKLEANDPVGAITKIQSAIADLTLAESLGAGDLTALKDLLGLVAEGIATSARQQALTAIPSPTPGQLKTFATISGLITLGHQQLLAHQYSIACDDFRQATSKALGMLK